MSVGSYGGVYFCYMCGVITYWKRNCEYVMLVNREDVGSGDVSDEEDDVSYWEIFFLDAAFTKNVTVEMCRANINSGVFTPGESNVVFYGTHGGGVDVRTTRPMVKGDQLIADYHLDNASDIEKRRQELHTFVDMRKSKALAGISKAWKRLYGVRM